MLTDLVIALLITAPCTSAQEVHRPCTGTLVPTQEALALLQCARQHLPECERLRAEASGLCEADKAEAQALCAAAKSQLAAERDAEAQAYQLCRADLAKLARDTAVARDPPWWRSPWLWTGVGVVVGAAGGYLVAQAVR